MSSSPKQGQIEIDEAEAKLVKDIFKLRSKGLSLAKIGAKYGFSKQKVDYILKNGYVSPLRDKYCIKRKE